MSVPVPRQGPKPLKKRKKPATPAEKQGAEDIERADSEGMGQQQDMSAKRRKKLPEASMAKRRK
jgi:hypothetical protein